MITELEDYCIANKVEKLSDLTASYII
jgi:hypothetical protein